MAAVLEVAAGPRQQVFDWRVPLVGHALLVDVAAEAEAERPPEAAEACTLCAALHDLTPRMKSAGDMPGALQGAAGL
jgi:hypothetical protein